MKICPNCRRTYGDNYMSCQVCNCGLCVVDNGGYQYGGTVNQNSPYADGASSSQRKQSGLGIAALVMSFLGCFCIIGIVLAIVDLCRKDGKKKTCSVIALPVSLFMMILLPVTVGSIALRSVLTSEVTGVGEASEGIATEKVESGRPSSGETEFDYMNMHVDFGGTTVGYGYDNEMVLMVTCYFGNNTDTAQVFDRVFTVKAFQDGVELKGAGLDSGNNYAEQEPGGYWLVKHSFRLKNTSSDVIIQVYANEEDKEMMRIKVVF